MFAHLQNCQATCCVVFMCNCTVWGRDMASSMFLLHRRWHVHIMHIPMSFVTHMETQQTFPFIEKVFLQCTDDRLGHTIILCWYLKGSEGWPSRKVNCPSKESVDLLCGKMLIERETVSTLLATCTREEWVKQRNNNNNNQSLKGDNYASNIPWVERLMSRTNTQLILAYKSDCLVCFNHLQSGIRQMRSISGSCCQKKRKEAQIFWFTPKGILLMVVQH